MSDPTTSSGAGCLGWLIAILLLPFYFWIGGSMEAGSVATLPDTSSLRIVLEPAASGDVDLERAVRVLTRRLELLGLTDATGNLDGNQITVEVPAAQVADTAALTKTLTTIGFLEFVDFSGLTGEQFMALENVPILTTGQAEAGIIFENAVGHPITGEAFTTVLTSGMLADVQAQVDQFGQWQVIVGFTPQGGQLMEFYTASHIGEPLAIVLDGRVYSTPIIQAALNSEAVIQGGYEEVEARNLAALLGGGALPVPLVVVTVEVVE